MGDEKIIYSMVGVNKTHPGGKTVIKDISLSYFYGAKIGVLGLNGAGKSTLLRIMAGVDQDFNGEAHLSDGYTVGYLEQEPQLDPDKTVREIVEEGVQDVVDLLKEFEAINAKFAEEMTPEEMEKLLEKQGKLQDKIEQVDGWSLDDKLNFAMDALRCPPEDQKISVLSGGERRRVALCRLLLKRPDILLLDEPTNHLDAESVQWLENHLRDFKGTVIAVTHDRYFLDNVAGWILELDRGHGIPWKGNYSSWLEQKSKRLAQEEKQEAKRQKTLERELEWIRMQPRARQSKNKARINSYDELNKQSHEKNADDLQIVIPPGERLGNTVIEVDNVTMGYEDSLLYEGLTFKIPRGAIVGVIGANGTGKTTLFKLITGEIKPLSGTVKIGETASVAYMDQMRDLLNQDKSVWEVVSDGAEVIQLGNQEVNSRAYLARFNITGSEQQKSVKKLSGGEKNRVQLALLVKQGGNVLLLDEPTNDLDVNTLRSLEEALINFPGCAIVVSHDRWFLDRIATHTLAFEGANGTHWFDGNYSEYEEDRIKRLGIEATKTPKRVQLAKIQR